MSKWLRMNALERDFWTSGSGIFKIDADSWGPCQSILGLVRGGSLASLARVPAYSFKPNQAIVSLEPCPVLFIIFIVVMKDRRRE